MPPAALAPYVGAPLPIAPKTMFQLTRYQGTSAGHVPVGRPRPWADALRLLQHANQVNGDVWAYRLACVSPELPRF